MRHFRSLKDYDWTLLVADNGSTDRTCEIVQPFLTTNVSALGTK